MLDHHCHPYIPSTTVLGDMDLVYTCTTKTNIKLSTSSPVIHNILLFVYSSDAEPPAYIIFAHIIRGFAPTLVLMGII